MNFELKESRKILRTTTKRKSTKFKKSVDEINFYSSFRKLHKNSQSGDDRPHCETLYSSFMEHEQLIYSV